MCPALSGAVFKMQKPAALSLKQFMMRNEILKLYRGFMRLGKMLNEPPPDLDLPGQNIAPVRDEWTRWVRAEFRLRVNSTKDDEVTRTLLAYGKRQLQEMERTIMLATNRNTSTVRPPPTTQSASHQCSSKNVSNSQHNSSQTDNSVTKSELGESSQSR